jgi:hypothetical protein
MSVGGAVRRCSFNCWRATAVIIGLGGGAGALCICAGAAGLEIVPEAFCIGGLAGWLGFFCMEDILLR